MTYSNKRAVRCIVLLLLCGMSGQGPHPVATADASPQTRIATTLPAAETLPILEVPVADSLYFDAGSAGTVRGTPESPPRHEVAILFNRDESRFTEVVNQLVRRLPREQYRLTLADVENEDSLRVVRALRSRPGLFVVAVGLPAARFARDELKAPIVFAEVFNYRELVVQGRVIRGVTAMPPLDLLVQEWKKLDPELRRVGLIVSERYTELIPAARSAVEEAGLTFESRVSSSDQETLYLFRRLTPQIDGLWLVPDDGILSPAVLGELLEYALSHEVGVSVSADALLDWGALLSASGTTDEIARRTHHILERMIAGEADSLPRLSPLSDLTIRINLEAADRLGLSSPRGESWVVQGQP